MESISAQKLENVDLRFKIKINDDTYSEEPFKIVDRGDITYHEFLGILESVYGLQHGSVTGLTYMDQDYDEVVVGSNEEFKQLLKSAHKWREDNEYCLLNVTTMNDSSDDFENIEPVYSATASASDIADSGSVQLKVLNKVNDMNKKLTPLLSAQSEPPVWFKEYMAQFKGEILQEVQGMMQKQHGYEKPTRSKPKYQPSPINDKNDIHRKIEKFTKKERKIQQKMSRKHDMSKLLKLNIKLRNINAEKNQLISSLTEEEKQQWKVSVQGTSKLHRMDSKEIEDSDKTCITVKPGATFEFVWTVINCGQLPWTEETHLNLISCSPGFEPIKTNVQCPLLEPGDIGQISMEFVAPKMSGTYSSIWNFTHGGYQFGHCLTCMIVVDSAGLPESGRALRSVTESPRSVKAKSQEDISSEDDETSCDDHSEDFFVIPACLADKPVTPRSTFSEGSIEIINPTPSRSRSPSRIQEFSQNGPGVYRTEDGSIVVEGTTLEKNSVIIVDEQGKCNISEKKGTTASSSFTPQVSQCSTSSIPPPLSFSDLLSQTDNWASIAQRAGNSATSLAEQAARDARVNAEQAVRDARANADQAANVATKIAEDACGAAEHAAKSATFMAGLAAGEANNAATLIAQQAMEAANRSIQNLNLNNTIPNLVEAAIQNQIGNMMGNNTRYNATFTTAPAERNSNTTPNESDANSSSGQTSTNTTNNCRNNVIPPHINVNEIINICTAQAANTAQNIVRGLLANSNLTAHAATAAQNVLGGFMSMSNTGSSTSEANTQTNTHANVQTNTQAHAQTNTQSNAGTNTQTNVQTNTGGPEAFVFSASQTSMPNILTQSMSELINILARSQTANATSSQSTSNTNTNSHSFTQSHTMSTSQGNPVCTTTPNTTQFGVYANYPQARCSSTQDESRIFVNHPQARPPMFTANSNIDAAPRRAQLGKSAAKQHSMQKMSKSTSAQAQSMSRDTDFTSALISSDNSDSGHLSNNSKSKKKALRKPIKLDRNYSRNKIHHRKKDSDSTRVDHVWLDLTRRVQDLSVSNNTPHSHPKTGNIWSLRPDVSAGNKNGAKSSSTRISAETFLNPVSFCNFPPVPNDLRSSTTQRQQNSSSPGTSGLDNNAGNASPRSGPAVKKATLRAGSNGNVTEARASSSNSNDAETPRVAASSVEIGEMMAQLIDMGFTDKKVNKKTLEECNYNVDAALHKLGALYSSISPAATAARTASVTQNTTPDSSKPNEANGESGFERELNLMLSHLMDMGFTDNNENMMVLEQNNFDMIHAVTELVNRRENATQGGGTGH